MKRRFSLAMALALFAGALVLTPSVLGSHAVVGPNVKVTDDNNNVDGGINAVTPSKDAQNRQSNETTVSISTVPSPVTGVLGDTVAEAANDYRMVPHFGDTWMPIYLSFDGGTTWFGAGQHPNGYNTMLPGFPTDTSPAGLASPLLGLDGAGDPVVRFDSDGNLLVGGIAFNRNRDPGERPLDTVGFVARYNYTPGSPATPSTTTSAGAPPNFTYAGTTIVDRGAVGFAVSSGFAGNFTDKPWMEVDLNSSGPCAGNVYWADTNFHGQQGSSPVTFSRSTDGGFTWSNPHVISTGGAPGASHNQGADIAVAPNGTVYVAWEAFSQQGADTINLVKSTDCGGSWTQPVVVNTISSPQAPGVAFRTPTFAFLATDTSNSNIVYAAYQNLVAGDYDIYAQRSTNGGSTWGAPVQVNTDSAPPRHQIFPTIEVSHGTLHVAWYDFRNSATPDNEALDVYYACSNCNGFNYPAFDAQERVTNVSHNGNCRMFGGGTVAFHGDYNELDALWNGSTNIVHVAWADNRDVPGGQCDLDPAPGPPSNNIGNRNQNVYEAKLTVGP